MEGNNNEYNNCYRVEELWVRDEEDKKKSTLAANELNEFLYDIDNKYENPSSELFNNDEVRAKYIGTIVAYRDIVGNDVLEHINFGGMLIQDYLEYLVRSIGKNVDNKSKSDTQLSPEVLSLIARSYADILQKKGYKLADIKTGRNNPFSNKLQSDDSRAAGPIIVDCIENGQLHVFDVEPIIKSDSIYNRK